MSVLLSPSLLSSRLDNMALEATLIRKAGISWLHLDIMDGSFVPNITFGPPVLQALRSATDLFFDVHLMIVKPERYIEAFARAGADLLVPHIEAMTHPERTLVLIREHGMKAGLALNPGTDLNQLRWLLPSLDMILIMGVNPGFSGQKFIPQMLEKLAECRKFLERHGYEAMPVQVDGGASPEMAPKLVAAGADILVSGSAFFRYDNYAEALKDFTDACAGLGENRNAKLVADKLRGWKHKA